MNEVALSKLQEKHAKSLRAILEEKKLGFAVVGWTRLNQLSRNQGRIYANHKRAVCQLGGTSKEAYASLSKVCDAAKIAA